MHKMKFPTSNSSLTVGSNNLQVSSDFNSSTSASGSQNRESSTSNTIVPQDPKKSENDSSQNMAAHLTSTAGNFFKRYTSSGHSATNAQEMSNFNTKVPSEADKVTITSEVSPNEIPKPIPAPPSNMAKSSSKNAASSKPGRAHRSRKMSRAPQPPNSETPAMNQKSVTSPTSAVQRPCQTHSFHTDAAEVQEMETVLLKLLDDFNSGKLRAFGQGCSMEQMSAIRDQQESLAKLHFELGARQDPSAPLSEEGLRSANDNMEKLMTRLEKLSVAIGQLNPASSSKNSPSHSNGGGGMDFGNGNGNHSLNR